MENEDLFPRSQEAKQTLGYTSVSVGLVTNKKGTMTNVSVGLMMDKQAVGLMMDKQEVRQIFQRD
jgi:hypothetical protein